MINTPEWRESIRRKSAEKIDPDLEYLNDVERVNLGENCRISILK